MRKGLVFILVLLLVLGFTSIASARLDNIMVSPSQATVTKGDDATFTVTVTDDGPPSAGNTNLSIQNNTYIQNASHFSVNPVNLGNNDSKESILTISTDNLPPGQYTFIIRATGGSGGNLRNLDSDLLTLTVTAAATAPEITSQPDDATITFGQDATFTASASGDPTPTIKWQVNVGDGWSDIAGENGDTLTLETPPVADSGNQYRAVFTNTAGSIETDIATLTVSKATPDVTFPTGTMTYGETLADADLTGEFASVDGSFSFEAPTTKPNAGDDQSFDATFTPTDSSNYNSVNGTIVVDVAKATPIITWSNPADITYGTPLSSTQLNATANVDGSFDYTPAVGILLNAGENQELSVTFTPTDTDNYQTANKTVEINVNPLVITVTPDTGQTKVYGETDPLSYTYDYDPDLIGTDEFTGALGRDSGENAGNYAITQGTLALNDNYSIDFVDSVTFEITPKPVIVNATANNKTYDGTTGATGNISLDGIVGDDVVNASGTFAFADKHVGDGKTVNVTDIALQGADADNYTLQNNFTVAAADITPRNLTFSSFVADDKEYDGNTSVTGDGFNDDRVADDVLTFNYDVAFEDKNAGEDKNVNFTNITISGGADEGNYTLVTTSGIATAEITKKDLKVTAVADDIDHGGMPVVTVEYEGFVLGEDEDVLDNTGFELGTTYDPDADPATMPVGTYVTTIAIGDAIDNNYNFNPLETSSFEVKDVTPPSAPTIDLTTEDWTNNDVTVTITDGEDETGGSGVARSEYRTKLDDDDWSDWAVYNGPFGITAEGRTLVEAITIDNAGNKSELSEQKTAKIDKTPPNEPTITLDPVDEWTNAASVTVTIDDEGDTLSGVDYVEFRTKIDDEPWSDWTEYSTQLTIEAEGLTDVEARVYDKAGNASQVSSETVKIDRTNPKIKIGSTTYTGGETIDLGYIAKGYLKEIDYIKTDDASGFSPSGSLTVSTEETIPTNVEGMDIEHDLTVTDQAGNSITITFKYNVISLDELAEMLNPMADGGVYNRNRTIPIKIQVVDNDGNPTALSSDDISMELKLKNDEDEEVDFSRTNNKPELDEAEFVLNNAGVEGSYFQYNLNVRTAPPIPTGIYTLEIYMNTEAMAEAFKIGEVSFTLR